MKNVAPYELNLQLWDGTKIVVTTDIKHTGGPILDPTASGFVTLKRWIENGATVNNTGVPPVNIARSTSVRTSSPRRPASTPTTIRSTPDFTIFSQVASPVLAKTCAAGNCHGTMTNALYLTRGLTPQEIRWNYFAAVDYLAATPPESEILRRPLATSQGGSYHEGGALFASVNDPSYQALVQWATKHGPLKPGGARSGVPVLRAEGAAGPRQEGLHDGPVPLGGDVPRLPPPRRLRRQLLAHRHAEELRLRARADVARE